MPMLTVGRHACLRAQTGLPPASAAPSSAPVPHQETLELWHGVPLPQVLGSSSDSSTLPGATQATWEGLGNVLQTLIAMFHQQP